MYWSPREFEILAALGRGETLAQIGRRLCVSQPAVSKALRGLERRVGLPLVDRGGHRVRLTSEGFEAARRAQSVLDRVRDLDDLVDDLRSGDAGLIRIVAAETPGNYLLPDFVGAFLDGHPDVEIELRVEAVEDLWQVFSAERYDLGVMPGAFAPRGTGDERWCVTPLYRDRVSFFVAPGHPLAGRAAVSWDELRQHTIIGAFSEPYWSDMWRELTHRPFEVRRLIPLRSFEAVKRMAATGGGVGMLFGGSLVHELAAGWLVPLPVADLDLSLDYAVVWPMVFRALPVVAAFRELLVNGMQAVMPSL